MPIGTQPLQARFQGGPIDRRSKSLGGKRVNSYLPGMAVKTLELADAADPDVITDLVGGSDSLASAEVVGSPPRRARVKVGGVFVTGDKASAAQVKHAVATSAEILERLGLRIVRPGIKLKAVRGIPLFSADPKHPGRFLRRLDGKVESGVLENGAFKVVD